MIMGAGYHDCYNLCYGVNLWHKISVYNAYLEWLNKIVRLPHFYKSVTLVLFLLNIYIYIYQFKDHEGLGLDCTSKYGISKLKITCRVQLKLGSVDII